MNVKLKMLERFKIHEILRQKYVSMVPTRPSGSPGAQTAAVEWAVLLESLGIKKMSKLMHLCVPAEDWEVRMIDVKAGSDDYLRIPRDTALKILVLGL